MISEAGEGHIGSAFSIVEILVALYFRTLRIDPDRPNWSGRDRFLLSKGHGGAALYAVLAERGYFPVARLKEFLKYDSPFPAHPDARRLAGVDLNTGSLGNGLSQGIGMALAARMDGSAHRQFVLLGDGELDEGMVWEAAACAAHHHLENLVAIVDRNGVQIDGSTESILALEPLADKWKSFGWAVKEISGHDLASLVQVLQEATHQRLGPTVILAHTIKGRGVTFMEGAGAWHYNGPSDERYPSAFIELGRTTHEGAQS
jgi:transketolase